MFFDLLAKKGRESELPEIAGRAFLDQYKEYIIDIRDVKVTTASRYVRVCIAIQLHLSKALLQE